MLIKRRQVNINYNMGNSASFYKYDYHPDSYQVIYNNFNMKMEQNNIYGNKMIYTFYYNTKCYKGIDIRC